MAIRPPLPARRPRAPNQLRDFIVALVVSASVVVFGLRIGLAVAGVEEWTIAWRVIAAPTDLLVAPLATLEVLDSARLSRLTFAEVIAATIVAGGALYVLSSLAIRRSR